MLFIPRREPRELLVAEVRAGRPCGDDGECRMLVILGLASSTVEVTVRLARSTSMTLAEQNA
jgi:hypothetical protein